MSMTKTPTKEDKLAAFKARDAQDRLERIALDAETLAALIEKATAAKAAAGEFETLCGDLVSDVSHHALKAQAVGGPSLQIENVLILARNLLRLIPGSLEDQKKRLLSIEPFSTSREYSELVLENWDSVAKNA